MITLQILARVYFVNLLFESFKVRQLKKIRLSLKDVESENKGTRIWKEPPFSLLSTCINKQETLPRSLNFTQQSALKTQWRKSSNEGKKKRRCGISNKRNGCVQREYSLGKKFPQNIYFNVKILSSSFY